MQLADYSRIGHSSSGAPLGGRHSEGKGMGYCQSRGLESVKRLLPVDCRVPSQVVAGMKVRKYRLGALRCSQGWRKKAEGMEEVSMQADREVQTEWEKELKRSGKRDLQVLVTQGWYSRFGGLYSRWRNESSPANMVSARRFLALQNRAAYCYTLSTNHPTAAVQPSITCDGLLGLFIVLWQYGGK